MYILSRKEMYAIDKYTIEEIGIAGIKLMENAGCGCAEFIKENILKEGKIAVFAGSGNNGGDGFVIARYLSDFGYDVMLFVVGKTEKMSPETLENYSKCKELSVTAFELESFDDFLALEVDLPSYGLVVDAIFGVGIKGMVKGWLAELIKQINKSAKKIVSIDIASGIDADSGNFEIAIRADYTLTMASPKYGQLIAKGREYTGKLNVIDIGIPQDVYKHFLPKGYLVNDSNVIYPLRSRFSHKGNYGKIVIIAGSPGFSGAAIMASKAALRAGGGLIYLLHPKGMEQIFEMQLLEVMTLSIKTISENIDFDDFWKFIKDKTAILIGPGMGVSLYSFQLIDFLRKNWNKPLVIDADGINTVLHYNMIDKFKGKNVLFTPHIGEFSKMTGLSVKDIEADRVAILREFCQKYQVNVLLKSATTIFSNGDDIIFNISGNDGLSTGGSGDVLAGIIVSFLGQGLDIKNAAVSASYLMGKTAEKMEKVRETASIIPSDIIENIFRK